MSTTKGITVWGRFLELPRRSGGTITVNVDHIIRIVPESGVETRLILTDSGDSYSLFSVTYADMVRAVQEAGTNGATQ